MLHDLRYLPREDLGQKAPELEAVLESFAMFLTALRFESEENEQRRTEALKQLRALDSSLGGFIPYVVHDFPEETEWKVASEFEGDVLLSSRAWGSDGSKDGSDSSNWSEGPYHQKRTATSQAPGNSKGFRNR